jgi:NTE family protein
MSQRRGLAPARLPVVRDVLRNARLLTSLDDWVLDRLSSGLQRVQVAAGEWLFRQGDDGDSLAIVVSGRLEVVAEGDEEPSVLRAVGPGDALGELALLTRSARSASVRAVRDSELLKLPREVFDRMLAEEPKFAIGLARALASDLQISGALDVPSPDPSVFAFVAVQDGTATRALASAVADVIRGWSLTAAVLDAATAPDGESFGRLLQRQEATHDVVLLIAERAAYEAGWTSFCVRSADRVVAVARSTPSSRSALDYGSLAGCDLALPSDASRSAVLGWTELLEPHARHRIDLASGGRTTPRLARRLTGRGVGLVLSGGGARGLAHIGVLERLQASGVEIDRVGGCSLGAFIAALHAAGVTPAEMRERFREHFVRRGFGEVRLPGATMLKARRASSAIDQIFGSSVFEELAVEAFAVSADLAAGELVVHRQGSVSDAVTASMAVPGLFPPFRRDGRVLVDGGVLDNLPVDVMAEAESGPIIAVDVMRRWGGPTSRLPVVETLARSMVLGGWQRSERNRARADVLVTPNVDAIAFLEFDRIDEAIEAGRRAADDALADLVHAGLAIPR